MENQTHSSKKPAEGGLISSVIQFILSCYAEIVSRPFKSGLVYFLAGLFPSLIIGWLVFPMALYSKQSQPLNFNHSIHAGAMEGETDLEKCTNCHAFRKDGTFVGIPRLEKCTECHSDPEAPLGKDPEEEKFLKEYVAKEKEVPWLSYSRQPDCVYFSHIAHVKMGKVECRTCHGNHGSSEGLPAYEENRLSGYSRNIWGNNIAGYKTNTWDRMKMDDCAECHTVKGHEENNACFVCHK